MRMVALVFAAALAGCASHIPQAIREAPPGNPDPAEVRAEPDRFTGTTVRWGGTIAEVHNRRDDTEVVVIARALSGDGRPDESSRSGGRFIAYVDGFLDPMVYSQGRAFTVTGTVDGSERRRIGDYPYHYPVVAVRSHYLWESLRLHPPYDYYPYDYYDPWYPGPYPWPHPWPRPWPHRPYYW